MKLEDGKSYGFGDIFNVGNTGKSLNQIIKDNTLDGKEAVKQSLSDLQVMSYVCKKYIFMYQIIIDILYMFIIPIGIALPIILHNIRYILIGVFTLFVLRFFTYVVQYHHPFIKGTAIKYYNRTLRYINEYHNNCNK